MNQCLYENVTDYLNKLSIFYELENSIVLFILFDINNRENEEN